MNGFLPSTCSSTGGKLNQQLWQIIKRQIRHLVSFRNQLLRKNYIIKFSSCGWACWGLKTILIHLNCTLDIVSPLVGSIFLKPVGGWCGAVLRLFPTAGVCASMWAQSLDFCPLQVMRQHVDTVLRFLPTVGVYHQFLGTFLRLLNFDIFEFEGIHLV